MWHIYTTEYYSAAKENEIVTLATMRMDLETVLLSEVRQRKTHIMISLNLKKMIQTNLFTKQKLTRRHKKQIYGYQRG